MKKAMTLLLALCLCLSLGVTALAATDTTGWKSDAITFTIYKSYKSAGCAYPRETVKFTSTADDGNPDPNINLTVNDLTVAKDKGNEITVNVPAFTKVGLYHFTIKEIAGNTLGVTYDPDAITLSVLVEYDYDNSKLNATVGLTGPGADDKKDAFVNEYNTGKLEVKKIVTGNLGEKDKDFYVHVELTAPEDKSLFSNVTYTDNGATKSVNWGGKTVAITITLKDEETVTFENIPVGVTYKVYELFGESTVTEDGYSVSYSGSGTNNRTNTTGTIDKDKTSTAIVTNNKEATIDTGVILDSLPYVLVLVGVIAVAAVMVLRRRRAAD